MDTRDATNHFHQLARAEEIALICAQWNHGLIRRAKAAGFSVFSFHHDDIEFEVPKEREKEFMTLVKDWRKDWDLAGASMDKIQEILGLKEETAEAIRDRLFDTYPAIRAFFQQLPR